MTILVIMQNQVVSKWLSTLHFILKVHFYSENRIDFTINSFFKKIN